MPPRRRGLPPLNALRAFEAFGRNGRMTAAAEELFVTHGAVSRQIRQLEEWLGYPLTEGPKTQLKLTPQAQRLLGAATTAFDLIQDAAAPERPAGQEVRLGCHGTMAIRWLIPRLGDFAERHPDVRLQLKEIVGEGGLESAPDVDAMVQVRTSKSAAEQQVTIVPSNWYGPVMSAGRWRALGADADRLMAEPRLHTRTWPQAWDNWARVTGLTAPQSGGRSFDHFSHALEAAAAGLGVAMAPWIFVADDVTAGRLVAPLGFVTLPGRLVLVWPQGRSSPALDRFAHWLAEQGRLMPAPPQPAHA